MPYYLHKKSIGVVFGRFQPLHIGHLEHIKGAYEECDFIYIGVTNPDTSQIKEDPTDPKRSLKSSNPFSYFDRYNMIKNSILNLGLNRNDFGIIPFPINFPELILNYAPKNATYFVTVLNNDPHNEWNYKKVKILKNLGLHVKLKYHERVISSTSIREKMRNGSEWSHLVPRSVYRYITSNGLNLGGDID